MADNMMETADSKDDIVKKRIQFLKIVVNIYRARVLSMVSACESLKSDVSVPDHIKNHQFLKNQIQGLHNDVTLLKAFQDCVNTVHNTITALGMANLNNPSMIRQLKNTVFDISYFSKHLISLYEENINEAENIRIKQEYGIKLLNYEENLELLREQQKKTSLTLEESEQWQKVENKVKKINIMRMMKQILIGKFAGNSKQLPDLQGLRSSCRKDLTVDDFIERWDVGI